MVSYSEDPVAGRLMMAGNPIKMTGLADPVDRRAARGLDLNRAVILRELAARMDSGAQA